MMVVMVVMMMMVMISNLDPTWIHLSTINVGSF